MKKMYLTPVVEEVKIEHVNLLIVSGGGGDITDPPGWGGGGGVGDDPDMPGLITPEELLGLPF